MGQKLGVRIPLNQAAQVANDLPSSLFYSHSGEITANKHGIGFQAFGVAAKINNVWLSVGGNGKLNSNPLNIAADVMVNGTSCLSTSPVIAASSATSAQATTLASGTGITQAVIDTANNTAAAGDVLTCDLTITRTDSPTTEISNVIVTVEITPV